MTEFDSTESVELKMYRDAFHQMILQKSSRVIRNDSALCAAVQIEELIQIATQTIRIYSGTFDDCVWCFACVQKAIRAAHERGLSINVIAKKGIPEDNRTLRLFTELGVGFKRFDSDIDLQDFLIIDDSAFRLELTTNSHNGLACAYSPLNARQLIEVFNKINSSEKRMEDNK